MYSSGVSHPEHSSLPIDHILCTGTTFHHLFRIFCKRSKYRALLFRRKYLNCTWHLRQKKNNVKSWLKLLLNFGRYYPTPHVQIFEVYIYTRIEFTYHKKANVSLKIETFFYLMRLILFIHYVFHVLIYLA